MSAPTRKRWVRDRILQQSRMRFLERTAHAGPAPYPRKSADGREEKNLAEPGQPLPEYRTTRNRYRESLAKISLRDPEPLEDVTWRALSRMLELSLT